MTKKILHDEQYEKAIKELLPFLKQNQRRKIFGALAIQYGKGGARIVAEKFHTTVSTVVIGMDEVANHHSKADAYDKRGRTPALKKMPGLEHAIRETVEPQSEADAKFQSDKKYVTVTAGSIQKDLKKKGTT